MSRPRTQVVEFDFRGGTNTAFSGDVLDATEVRLARNARLSTLGAVVKRAATQRLHPGVIGAAADVVGLQQWDAPAVAGQLVALSAGNLYHKALADADFTLVAGALSTTRRARWAAHRDGANVVLYFADGALRSWDGTTLVQAVAGAPAAREIARYKGRMFAADGTKRLYWSEVADPTLWDVGAGGGFADVETFDSDGVTGLIVVGSSLLICKANSIARFTGVGQQDIQIDTQTEGVSAQVGVIAPQTLVSLEAAAFFLSDRGPYIADESGVQEAGLKVSPEFDFANRALWGEAVAAYNRRRREVWVFLPAAGEAGNLTGWVMNLRTRSWSGPWSFGFGASVLCRYQLADGSESVAVGGYDGFVRDGDVDALPSARDDVLADGTGGTPIELDVELPPLLGGAPGRMKAMRGIASVEADLGAVYDAVAGTGGRLEVYWSSELGAGSVHVPSRGAGAKDYRVHLTALMGRRPVLGLRDSTAERTQLAGVVLPLSLGRTGR